MRMATRGLRRVHLLKRLLARIAPIPGIETFGLLLAILGATLLGPGGANASVPAQFTDSLIASVPGPTGMAFLPDGRLLVSSKGGFVYLVSGGSLITVVDLSGVVCTDRERGVLGVAVDPSYSSNRFIYVYYTYNKFGNDCPINDPSDPVNRVSRFTTSSSGPAGSEIVLIDNILSPGGYHNAGDLAFGSDGYLYVSVGDGVCDLTTPSDCGGHNNNARLQNILNGKILRITSAGAIPPSNPFMDPDSGRCNLTGQTSKAKCQETYAWGFRNPYQFAVDPNTSGRIYVNDVGQDAHEEVDNLAAGADYGWNLCEGSFTIFSSAPCTAAGTTGPILDYAHSGGCGAITGAAFVPNGVWPSDYDGRYLFADYNCSKIFKIKNGVRTDFASADGGLTAIKFGKSGSTQALYYGTYTNGGEIHKIVYNAPANLPTAAFTLSTRNGLLPLSVSFNGSASTAVGGRTISSYSWDFGDGTPKKSGAKTSHTFTTAALRTVKLTVTDSTGASSSVTHTVDAGNSAPTPSISSPSSTLVFATGMQITLTGSAADREEGPLSDSHLTWEVVYNHGGVATTLLHAAVGNNLHVLVPQPADVASAAASTITISLTATDSHGLHKTTSRTIKPKLTTLNFITDPVGANVRAGEVAVAGPSSIKTWANSSLKIEAIGGISSTGQPLAFSSWSDAGAATHTITVPASDASFTATFSIVNASPYAPIADATVRDSTPNTNLGTSTVLSVRSSSPRDRVYLQFNVAGVSGTVTSAKLYLYALTSSVNTPTIYKTTDNWTETGLTYANRPAPTGSALPGASGVSANSWVVFDVTGSVTANGTVSFVLQRDTQTTAQFVSREGGDNAPRLILTGANDGAAAAVNPPANLHTTAYSSSIVDLAWTAPAPADGVTGYDVERDGALVTTIGPGTTYRDQFLDASTTYSYRMRARTADGASTWSSAVGVTTPPTTSTSSIQPTMSASVSEDGSPNPGTPTCLNVSGTTGHRIETYLKFQVPALSGPVFNAELRLFVVSISPSGSPASLSVYRADPWASGITWASKPPKSPSPYGVVADAPTGAWITVPVASVLTGSKYLAITSDSDAILCISGSGGTAPQLVVIAEQGAAGSSAQPTKTPTATATPTVAAGTPTVVSSPAETPVPTATATPTPPISDGFENGLVDWPTVTGLTVASDVVADGNASARSISSGTHEVPGQPSFAQRSIGDPKSEVWVATSLYIVHPSTGLIKSITLFDANNNPVASISINETSELILSDLVGGANVNLGAIAPSEWRRIEMHVRLSGNEPVVEAWLDGSFAGSIALLASDAQIATLQLGDAAGIETFDIAYDNVAIDVICIGTCPPAPQQTPTVQATNQPTETATMMPTEPAPTAEPTETPTLEPAPTDTPEPTIEPEPPTSTPTVEAPPEGSPPAEAGG